MAGPRIAVIGAGITGLAATIALRAAGIEVEVFEQAPAFKRVGSAINMTSNAVKVLDGLGVGEAVRDSAHTPRHRISRRWDTNEETSRVVLGEASAKRYGAPQLMVHRADLLKALQNGVPEGAVRFGKKLSGLSETDDGLVLAFADGSTDIADGVIGADGIHSVVRDEIFGPDSPVAAGMLAYRSEAPAERLGRYDLTNFVKWWGPTPDSQIVAFLINRGRDLYVFATTADTELQRESWSFEGDIDVLRETFKDYHREPREILEACEATLVTALYERRPLECWAKGGVALMGDACHAMMPFMAQGAAMGLEDAAVLSRCVRANADWAAALGQYERTRIERASRIQRGSHQNEWLRNQGNPDWVYGYDAWTVALA